MQTQMQGMQALLQQMSTENSSLKAELKQHDVKKKEELEREKRIQEYKDELAALLQKETEVKANIAEAKRSLMKRIILLNSHNVNMVMVHRFMSEAGKRK